MVRFEMEPEPPKLSRKEGREGGGGGWKIEKSFCARPVVHWMRVVSHETWLFLIKTSLHMCREVCLPWCVGMANEGQYQMDLTGCRERTKELQDELKEDYEY